MPAVPLPNGLSVFLDANGAPLSGGQVYTYVPATTTPKTTWTDSSEGTANSNPIILNAAGQAAIWGDGAYRQRVFDSLGNLQWDATTLALTAADVIAELGPFTGDTGSGGTIGPVPAPPAGSAALGEYLGADGTWGALKVVLPAVPAANQAGYLGCPQRVITASDNLKLSDLGGNILNANASPGNLGVPSDASASWPTGVVSMITISNPTGSGALSIVPASGVTLVGPGAFASSGTRIVAANGQVLLSHIAANSWTIVGAGIS